jgi:hypothetical protein
LKKFIAVIEAAGVATSVAGCGGSGSGLTSASTCQDWNAATSAERGAYLNHADGNDDAAIEAPYVDYVCTMTVKLGSGPAPLGGVPEPAVADADDEIIARFEDASDGVLRGQAARAMVDKAKALDRLGRSDEAISVYRELLARFPNDAEAERARELLRAMSSEGQGGDVSGERQREVHVEVHHGDEVPSSATGVVVVAYWAEVFPGVFASGDTIGELIDAVEQAIALYVTEPGQSAPVAVELVSVGFTVRM